MTATVLVPYDGSAPAKAALEYALDRHPDAHLVVFSAVNILDVARVTDVDTSSPEYWAEQVEQSEADAERLLEDVRQRVEGEDVEVELETRVGAPATAILEDIEERDVDEVVMGSHGRKGLTRVVLGSIAEKVVRRAPVPVTIVPAPS